MKVEKYKRESKRLRSLISLKFSIIDYLEIGVLSENHLFSEILKKYVSIKKVTSRKLADNLGVHETKFSRIINNKENPGLGLLYRIEVHSNNILPASLLWHLVARKMLVEIDTNIKEKNKQSKHVKNRLILKTA